MFYHIPTRIQVIRHIRSVFSFFLKRFIRWPVWRTLDDFYLLFTLPTYIKGVKHIESVLLFQVFYQMIFMKNVGRLLFAFWQTKTSSRTFGRILYNTYHRKLIMQKKKQNFFSMQYRYHFRGFLKEFIGTHFRYKIHTVSVFLNPRYQSAVTKYNQIRNLCKIRIL